MSQVAMHEATNPDLWQYGVVGTFALLFLAGLIHLFRMYVKSRDLNDAKNNKLVEEHTKEEGVWEKRMVEVRGEYERKHLDLRAEYERKHREAAEEYAKEVRDLYEDSRSHEDTLRKEYGEMLSGMSGDYTRSSAEIVRVLDKFYDRFVGPRARAKRD